MHSTQPHTSMNQRSPYFWLKSQNKYGPVPRQCWRWLESQDWVFNKKLGKVCSAEGMGQGPSATNKSIPRPPFWCQEQALLFPFPGSVLFLTAVWEPRLYFLAMHKYLAELIRNEDGWSDSLMALLQAPCVASSSRISVSPQKMTNRTSLLPKGAGG